MRLVRSALAAASLALLCSCLAAPRIKPAYPGDRPMWEHLASASPALPLPEGTVAAIAPHHLIDGEDLGRFWRGIAGLEPPVIVVIGPNHEGNGPRVALPCRAVWESPFGETLADEALAETVLRGHDAVRRSDLAFRGEHSIHAHVPFIQRLLPRARFLPLVVHTLPEAEAVALGQALARVLPPGSIVVASVDFSHFQPSPWADFHDEVSEAAIEALSTTAVYRAELDSPASLAACLAFATARGGQRALPLLHTNSQQKQPVYVPDSTSHLYYALLPGPSDPAPTLSVMATGDAGSLSGLGVLAEWRWNPGGAPTSVLPVPGGKTAAIAAREPRLDSIRSGEDRFFAGADLAVFDLAPGVRAVHRVERGPASFECALAGMGADELARDIAGSVVLARRGAAFLVLVIDWRGRPPDPALAVAAAGAGASLVLGRNGGPALLPFAEGSSLIALSLGGFFPVEAGRGGAVLGLTLGSGPPSWRCLPLVPDSPAPRLDPVVIAGSLGLPLALPPAEGRE